MQEKVLQGGTDKRIELRGHLGVAQLLLGLPLELGLLEVEAEDRYQPLAHVLGGERYAFGREVMDVEVVAHCLDDAGLESGFMGTAKRGRDAIHEGVDTLLWRFSPGEHAVQGWVVLTLESEDLRDDRFLLTVGQELGQIGPKTILVVVPGLFAGCLVAQD